MNNSTTEGRNTRSRGKPACDEEVSRADDDGFGRFEVAIVFLFVVAV